MGEWDVVKEEKLDPWAVVEERPVGDFLQTAGVTPESSFDLVQSIKRNALPVAGDVAMTYAASRLPAGKSLMGPQVARMLKPALGGAAGAVGGELAAQQAFDEPFDPEKAKAQGAMGFGGTLGMSGFLAAMRPAVKAMRPVLDPIFNLATDLTVLGSKRKAALRQRLLGEATADAEQFVYEAAPEMVKNADVGIDSVRLKIQTALDENKAVYQAYRPAIEKAAEKEGGLLIDNTQQWLSERLKEHFAKGKKIGTFLQETFGYVPRNEAERDVYFALQNIVKTTESGMPASVADFNSALSRVYGSRFDKVGHEAWKDNRVKLKELLVSDLEKYPEAFALKTQADETMRAVNQYKFLYERIFKPALKDDVLNPQKLAENIYLHKGEVLKRDELKALWPMLEKKAKLYQDVAETLGKSEQSINFGGIEKLGAVGGGVFRGSPETVAAAELFGMMSAYALVPQMSRPLLLKLMEPVAHTAVKGGLRIGNDMIDFGGAQ
jgi:hypothetical protein